MSGARAGARPGWRLCERPPRIYTERMIFSGVVWHFWIAVPLAVGAIVAVVASIVGYLQKVTYKRYPRD